MVVSKLHIDMQTHGRLIGLSEIDDSFAWLCLAQC